MEVAMLNMSFIIFPVDDIFFSYRSGLIWSPADPKLSVRFDTKPECVVYSTR